MGTKNRDLSNTDGILSGRKNIIKHLMDTKGTCLVYSEDKECYDFIKVIFADESCFGAKMTSYKLDKLIPVDDMAKEILYVSTSDLITFVNH